MKALIVYLAISTVAAYYMGRLIRVAREKPEVFGSPKRGAFWKHMVLMAALVVGFIFMSVVYWLLNLLYVSSWASVNDYR